MIKISPWRTPEWSRPFAEVSQFDSRIPRQLFSTKHQGHSYLSGPVATYNGLRKIWRFLGRETPAPWEDIWELSRFAIDAGCPIERTREGGLRPHELTSAIAAYLKAHTLPAAVAASGALADEASMQGPRSNAINFDALRRAHEAGRVVLLHFQTYEPRTRVDTIDPRSEAPPYLRGHYVTLCRMTGGGRLGGNSTVDVLCPVQGSQTYLAAIVDPPKFMGQTLQRIDETDGRKVRVITGAIEIIAQSKGK